VYRLSFIVPAYNEESGLGATLDAIRQAASLTGESYEVIVVDDASTDQTSAVAASRGATIAGLLTARLPRLETPAPEQPPVICCSSWTPIQPLAQKSFVQRLGPSATAP
jgi:cellulose synthase/poly-beta-1,6-N-acetylglucosamine synthase-like glycosyltransferase